MEVQCDLFPELEVKRTRNSKDYGAFTDKFKTKLTTDDCYTPEAVYIAVRDWCVKKYGLEGREIVRPFWPGGDFEMFDYPDNCVVIDNPPFSLYDRILNFYTNVQPVDFFLFGPSLTLFKRYDCCYVVANETVTYANGAKVNTSFATSLDRENRIVCDTSLKNAIHAANTANKPKKADLHVLCYPESLVTSAILGKTSRVDFAVKKKDAEWVTHVNGDHRIFGSGFLLSDRAAADRAAADRAAERKKKIIEFGPQEKEIIERLNRNSG